MSQQVKVYRDAKFLAGATITGPRAVLEHHTASDTLTFAESGSVHTNLGAVAAVNISLPQKGHDGAVAGLKGVYYDIVVMAAQNFRVDPGAAGAIYVAGAKGTDDKQLWADDEAECLRVIGDGNGDWVAINVVGTWTAEA